MFVKEDFESIEDFVTRIYYNIDYGKDIIIKCNNNLIQFNPKFTKEKLVEILSIN